MWTGLGRSLSSSEQEAKDARIQSQKIVAQLTTPPSTNSKGVLLFNRRRKRVNAFTLTSYGKGEHCTDLESGSLTDGEGRDPGDGLAGQPGRKPPTSSDSSEDTSLWRYRGRAEGHAMESTLTVGNHEEAADPRRQTGAEEDYVSEVEGLQGEEVVEEDGGERELAGEPGLERGFKSPTVTQPVEISHSVKPARTTVEVHLSSSYPPHDPDSKDLLKEVNGQTGSGGQHGQSHMVHRPEEKQPFLANRTPKPFSAEGGSPKPYKPPASVPEIAPYAPVYSRQPPGSQRTSSAPPPGSSAPGVEQSSRPPAMWANKTGILEESRIRRAAWKPMFTFSEKPKVAPNPELLSLVQGIDVQKRKGSQGEALAEDDDSLGLGAEAATFNPQKKPSPPVAPKPPVRGQEEPPVPEWASCLKPPELRAPRTSGASQALAEVKGKGAELFARRQTRMERYTIEAPVAMETRPRPPSPTMSLPPSWKCSDEPFDRQSVPAGPRSPVSAFARVGKANGNPAASRQQHQHHHHHASSSLFIISPEKNPVSSLPKGAPSPPRLLRPNPAPASYLRQTSTPLSSCPPTAAKPPPAAAPSSRLNGFTEPPAPSFQPPPPPGTGGSSSPSPRATKGVLQVPRPSFSARKAGLEAQGPVSPGSSLWKASFERRLSSPRLYTDTFRTPPESPRSPFSPVSSSSSPGAGGTAYNNWSPLGEPKASSASTRLSGSSPDSRRLKELLAKNVLSAARRKKLSSPPASSGELPPSPHSPCPSPLVPLSPSVVSPDTPGVRSPLRLYRRSLTDSEFSLASDDSGPRSPSYYNFCPRGWTGSKLRQSEQL
ncbi:synaptopodin isoform X2 [Stegostoma tigrinum]|uniref:synaptopodin isoform X2 n=1 Tax=Stegostoma tigrinum TaxID=3053191 RepID=UPI00287092F3|nr:synaptopodin isoform X2 [Stegostoma tigrinum]